ncbi:DUF4168 domain-containing protein [Chitinispirillales bacterium ANBcel5]|uniref:DUF4168 domain-containing protein n=1 Tax=Cellulosispirillum alkaliphilum TaxID=3039283 RepID=UPI002A4E56D8|nr:DUF4168 domain-containing protein [Chitinispirillales bacterium ANBcel5]
MLSAKKITSVISALTLTFFFVAPSIAQEAPPPSAAEPVAEVEVSEQDLEKTADAYRKIAAVQQQLQAELQTAEDQESRLQLQQSANKNMMEAVESSGLSVEQYNTVMQQVNADKELAQKFQQLMME